MSIESNTKLITELYDAVIAGDLAGALAPLDENVRLIESDNLDYGGTHVGIVNFTRVLGQVAGALQLADLTVHRLVAANDSVVAFLRIPLTDGGEVIEIIEWWTIRDGRVLELQAFYGNQDLMARAVAASASRR